MFNCKVCAEKDRHLATMRDEIDCLRRLVQPAMQVLPPADVSFLDKVLVGNHETPNDPEAQEAQETMLAEADRLLTGTYDNY